MFLKPKHSTTGPICGMVFYLWSYLERSQLSVQKPYLGSLVTEWVHGPSHIAITGVPGAQQCSACPLSMLSIASN